MEGFLVFYFENINTGIRIIIEYFLPSTQCGEKSILKNSEFELKIHD
jgi:hypothetical protein